MASLSRTIAARRPRPVVETAVVTGVVALNVLTVNASGSDERAWCPLHLSPLPGDTVSIMRGPQGVLVVALLAAGLDVEPPTPPPPDESGIATVLATSAHTWLQPIGFDLPNTWKVLSASPAADDLSKFGVASIGTKFYIVGGITASGSHSSALWEFDTVSGDWIQRASLPESRVLPMVAAIGTKLYVAGGYDSSGTATTATLYEWDQSTNTWDTKAPMPVSLGDTSAASIGSKIYVVGGWSQIAGQFSEASRTLLEWDQASNSWSEKAQPAFGDTWSVASLAEDLYAVIIYESVVYKWSQSTNTWTQVTPSTSTDYVYFIASLGGALYGIDVHGELRTLNVASGEWGFVSSPAIDTTDPISSTIGTDLYIIGLDSSQSNVFQRWTRDGSTPVIDQKYVFDWSRTWAQQGTVDPDQWIGQICYPPSGLYYRADSVTVRLTLVGAGPTVTLQIAPTRQVFPQPSAGFGPAAPAPGAAPIQVEMTPGETTTMDLPASWWTVLAAGGGLVVYGSDVARLAGPDRDPQAGMLRIQLSPTPR